MKRKVLVLLTLVISLAVLTGCNNKKSAITSTKFTDVMINDGYNVVDVKNQFNEYDQIKEAYVALSENEDYQIEFYVLENDDEAISFYENNKQIFEESKVGVSTYKNFDLNNTNKYILTTDGKYKLLSRIDNTMIYLNVDEKYKENVVNVLKKIGY